MKFKYSFRFVFYIFLPAFVSAQTNTFPTSGNVGVGTTSPSVKLQVVGSFAVQGGAGFPTTGFGFEFVPNAAAGVDAIQTFDRDANSWREFRLLGSALSFYSTWVERMRIDPNGNVGIGTTNPQVLLHVQNANGGSMLRLQKTVATTGAYDLGVAANGDFLIDNAGVARLLTVTSSGNVGIGTATPSYLLHVNGQGRANSWVISNPAYVGSLMLGSGANYEPGLSSDTNLMLIGGNGANVIQKIGNTEAMRIAASGNVGIGTTNPTQKLSVNGTIRAKEVIVDTGWSDYVFEKDYRLAPLSEVEQHIKTEKHLPGIPSTADVAAHGVSMGEMQAKLLAKVEELTLHLIAQEKEITTLRHQVAELKTSNP